MLPGLNLLRVKICTLVQSVHILSYNYLTGSLINAITYKCADSPEGYGAFLRLFVRFFFVFCCCCFLCVFFFVYMFDSCFKSTYKG